MVDEIGVIRPININEEMRGSYLDYAMSVIVARALPDARDGLKPVQRRILFAMYDMGIRANAAYKKSARIVGEVLGKYHPHGDSAVYEAMARMAQTFSLRYPLVDGQGNFGSVDGDAPAAMRYTEARLARTAEELLVDIDMNTVDFGDNYDGTQEEPLILPGRLPNLLLNLSAIPDITFEMVAQFETLEEISVDDLMQFVRGPDFPTAAEIIVGDELKEAYATGRGRVTMRASAETEETKNGRYRIVFSAIPYQVSKTAIVERIVQLVREDKLNQISDLRDESDRTGMRLVVELKASAQPNKVLNQLYKYTQLQSTFSIQMLALVNGEPRNLSLKRALHIHIQHRCDVIVRRSKFELAKRQARAHILEGLLKALSSLDAIIATIRAADSADMARDHLIEGFDLSEAQANAILEMQLRRLAALERLKLQEEFNEVQARIAYLDDLIHSPDKILGVIRADITEVAEKYGDARRTQVIYGVSTEFNESDFVRDEEVVILLTNHGYIKRVPSSAYKQQRRGGKGVTGMKTKEEDGVNDILTANSLDTLLFFTNRGRVYSQRTFHVPEAARAGRGTLVQTFLPLTPGETITAIVPVASFDTQGYFVLATRRGRIKRVQLDEFEAVRPSGLIAMSLEDNDEMCWAKYTDGDQDLIIATENGQSLRFHEERVRAMGRQAGGVLSMKLVENDTIIGMDTIGAEDTHILVVTERGFSKRTPLEAYRKQGRNGHGIKTLDRTDKTGPVVAMRCINPKDDILVLTSNGIVLRSTLEAIRDTGRVAQGVKLIDLANDDAVIGIAIMEGVPEGVNGDIDIENLNDANGDGSIENLNDDGSVDVELSDAPLSDGTLG